MAYIPDRGEAIWLMFDPQAGNEQAGSRPALVISPRTYNGITGLSLVCPITSQVKGYAFEVAIPSGWPVTGVVLSDQIKSLDWRARKADLICVLPVNITEDVIAKILPLLE